MFNVGSHFEIGSSHKVCEDFAIHGSFETPSKEILYYGIVTDGCSSSMVQGGVRLPINTDTGARLLALIAKQAIREIIPTLKELDAYLYNALKISILKKMDILLRQLELPIPAMDCTLLINLVYEGRSFFVVWGDGVFVSHGGGTGDTSVIELIEFESGAPYYLSYHLDKERNELYFEKFGDKKKIKRQLIFGSKEGMKEYITEVEYDAAVYVVSSFPSSFLARFSIISDGASSFQQKSEGQNEKRILPPEEVVPQLVAFKGVRGDFLGRMMNITHRWMKKKTIDHYDDLAIATIAELPKPKGENDAIQQ